MYLEVLALVSFTWAKTEQIFEEYIRLVNTAKYRIQWKPTAIITYERISEIETQAAIKSRNVSYNWHSLFFLLGFYYSSFHSLLTHTADLRIGSNYGATFSLSNTGHSVGIFTGILVTSIKNVEKQKDFPEEGAQICQAPTYYLTSISWKLHEKEDNWAEGGGMLKIYLR